MTCSQTTSCTWRWLWTCAPCPQTCCPSCPSSAGQSPIPPCSAICHCSSLMFFSICDAGQGLATILCKRSALQSSECTPGMCTEVELRSLTASVKSLPYIASGCAPLCQQLLHCSTGIPEVYSPVCWVIHLHTSLATGPQTAQSVDHTQQV